MIKADPSVLSLKGVAQTVQGRLRDDSSIAVRESVLDLLGEYLRLKPELITQYYATIASRLSDPGVSVRKRVIKILREVCTSSAASIGCPSPSASAAAPPPGLFKGLFEIGHAGEDGGDGVEMQPRRLGQ